MPLDYLSHIRAESARFGAVLRDCDPDRQVPTCPEWTAADLLWHLTEVQHFWGTIVRGREQSPPKTDPPRPETYADALAEFETSAAVLADALAETPDDVAVWTWSSDHTIGFVRRRQAHEALIHRLDAELTADAVTEFDPDLALDGVDEVMRVMFGGMPEWASWEPTGPTGTVRVAGRAAEWPFRMGRQSGTSPESGTVYTDELGLEVLDAADSPSFTVTGSAADLDAYLWNRPTWGEVQVDGNEEDHKLFLAMIRGGIQ
jgi:uncharacterized protein (TIGR03083 family)